MSYKEQLKDFKRRNKTSRPTKAKKEGFDTPEAYIKHLEDLITKEETTTTNVKTKVKKVSSKKIVEKTTEKKPKKVIKTVVKKTTKDEKISTDVKTIHYVDVLDTSVSMNDKQKFTNAVEGLNKALQTLIESFDKDLKKGIRSLYTRVLFNSSSNISIPILICPPRADLKLTQKFTNGASTALNDAIIETIKTMFAHAKPEDKVVINIYTDGSENGSKKGIGDTTRLIREAKGKGYVITFIGTNLDVEKIIKFYEIDESNTLAYDNTGESLKKALDQTILSRQEYSENVSKGLDTNKGFYKKTIQNNI